MVNQRIRWALVAGSALVLAAPAPGRADAARDPFWPVGYVPEGHQEEAEQPKEGQELLDLSRLSAEEQAIIKSHLRVGGILEQGRNRVAIINSDIVSQGDVMKLRVRGGVYRFLIRSLDPENIVLEPIREKPSELPIEPVE